MRGPHHLRRLTAVGAIAGMLALTGLTALPASASSNAYTVKHCTKWEVAAINGNMNAFWNQVHLLAVAPAVVLVRHKANALLANDTQHRRTALDNACWTVPGMGP